MTAGCLALPPDRGQVTFCGAGQPPLLVARHGGAVQSIRAARPPLGLNKAEHSIEVTCGLADGDAILLYTDGLYEMQNSDGVRLGHEALARMLPPVGSRPAADWLGTIIERAEAYAGDVSFPDDIAAFAAVYSKE